MEMRTYTLGAYSGSQVLGLPRGTIIVGGALDSGVIEIYAFVDPGQFIENRNMLVINEYYSIMGAPKKHICKIMLNGTRHHVLEME